MEEQVWAAGVICMYSLLMQKVLSQQLCEPQHHNSVNIAWRLKVSGASEEERACVSTSRSSMRECVGAAFWGTGQVWSQMSQSKCTLSSTHLQTFLDTLIMWNRDGPDGRAVRELDGEKGEFVLEELVQLGSQIQEEGQPAYKLMIHLKVCSLRGPQGRI